MKILILGSTGLLGHMLFNVFSESSELQVFGTIRNDNLRSCFNENYQKKLLLEGNLLSDDTIFTLLEKIKPDVVINCISARNRKNVNLKEMIGALSFFPKQLSFLANLFNFKLIHISSDGVFSGVKGNYSELDIPDPADDYGLAKFLGEDISNTSLVLRTTFIGPELIYKEGFFEWFLVQNECIGYTQYIFSALTTSFLSTFLLETVLNNMNLRGIYHIGSEPISKFDLMQLIVKKFNKKTKITADDSIKINRSLNCNKLKKRVDFSPPKWSDLINEL